MILITLMCVRTLFITTDIIDSATSSANSSPNDSCILAPVMCPFFSTVKGIESVRESNIGTLMMRDFIMINIESIDENHDIKQIDRKAMSLPVKKMRVRQRIQEIERQQENETWIESTRNS